MKNKFVIIILLLTTLKVFPQSTFFVKFKEHVSPKTSEAIFAEYLKDKLQKKNNLSEEIPISIKSFSMEFGKLNSNLNNLYKIKADSNTNIDSILNELRKNIDVEYVQKSLTYNIDLIPSDSLYSEQWGLQNINAQDAWDLIPSETGEIILAVIDTGIDFEHPDLKKNIFKNEGEIGIDNNGNDKSSNGIDDDNNGFIDDFQGWDFVDKLEIFPAEMEYDFTEWDNIPMDEHGHGTNISGIIGAEHNSFGIAGVNPNVKILNLRAFDKNGNGEEDDVASAIIYAVKMGAKVINMSWGDTQFSQVLKDVIEFAYENDVVLVASAGNTSSNLPHYPSSFSQVISVGAIQENNALASFSNYGSTMDLVAPGSQIITTDLSGSYKKVSGTSASAPFVSASASIVYSIKNFNNEEIKQLFKSTTKDLGESGWDENYGAGSLNLFKALSLLTPSEIKFNFPTQDYTTDKDSLNIIVTCVSPYFKNYELYYGIGFNPENWQKLETGKENYQFVNEKIYTLNITDFIDTSYTLRLLINKIDNSTLEERVNFSVDRTAPEVLSFGIFPALLNDIETIQASIITDDPTVAKLFYRTKGSNEEFQFISLDGFSSGVHFNTKVHFGFLPTDITLTGINHEFYFEVTNQAGLTTLLKDGVNYFSAINFIDNDIKANNLKTYSLPTGRIFNKVITMENVEGNFLFLNETETSSDLSIYKNSITGLQKEGSLNKRIPVSVGDFNNDGKTDILSLFVKNGFIETQVEAGSLEFTNVFSDTSGEFWPSLAEDFDNDNKIEIISFNNDTSIAVWEVQNNFTLIKESTLDNFVEIKNNFPRSIFRNNISLIDDFDNDLRKEIVTVDDFGRLLFYQINGNGNYTNDFTVEPFYPLESNSRIAKGDFNGDGIKDIAILIEFEENVFTTPLIYASVITIAEGGIEYLFQNMFITTESNYVSSFQKQYRSIGLKDINNDGKDELIVFTFPNSYVFENTDANHKLIDFKTNVNSQSIFIGDLDNNGIDEIAIPDNSNLNFYEFVSNGLPPAPTVTDYYSLDANRILIKWNENNLPVYIFRGNDIDSLILYDSSNTNTYVDENVESNKNYFYKIANYDPVNNNLASTKSKIIKIYSHAPAIATGLKVQDNKNIELFFSQKIGNDKIKSQNFLFNGENIPNSIKLSSESSLLITSTNTLDLGIHEISFKNLRDFYNSPINDTTISFEVVTKISDKELIISNFEIIDNYNLVIRFNMMLDSVTSLNINNYTFSPNNTIKVLEFNNHSPNEIHIQSENPFGSIGREYVLSVKNIYSSQETGYIKISENSGSQVILTDKAENMDDLYVYPNPVKIDEHPAITFANLPAKVDIYVYDINGIFVNKVTEDDGNGGVDWDLKNEIGKKIESGIYIFKAISLDSYGNSLEEKIGKFAVIK